MRSVRKLKQRREQNTKLQETISVPTVKTADIIRLINGVNQAAEKSEKLQQLLEEAEEKQSVIDKELLETEGIYYDEDQNLYFDMQTGNVIDLQFIDDRLKEIEGMNEDPDASIN